MGRPRRLIALATLVLLAPALGAAKCSDSGSGSGSQGGTRKACDLREAQYPIFKAGPGRGLIEATVHAVCDVPPRQRKPGLLPGPVECRHGC